MIEKEIKTYLINAFHIKKEKVESLELTKLLSLVEMKNKDKWNQFRKKLREEEWIA